MTRRVKVIAVALVAASFVVTFYVLRRANEPHRASEVVALIEHGGLSTVEAHRGYHPFDAAFAALPDPLPSGSGLNSDFACVGHTPMEVVLASGEHIYFGACGSVPTEFMPTWCLMIELPPPDPGRSSCGKPASDSSYWSSHSG